MNLLLDTHTFLWFIGGSLNLSDTARNLIETKSNQRFMSIASLWEMSIKVSIGKLKLAMPFTELVRREVNDNAIEIIGILPEHLDALAKLTFHHKDPFDRLIIAQSLVESMPIVTRDTAFFNYPIKVLW
ncbi:type II toxin-antitoxin system VapC family toxin [Argonema galeatum]|uniref:type II toxin-antitoxin system VapC family toxin n=1 Tax=Argonema galeatum TaxID=2942762 RepID=UPI00201253A6|nr:type II toxin-antitoxin system VapC family toxin [Argonema galeatum]MCL1466290.1 type II toxin-antitoxin system VapC family toxin [Argonema galeatum A003/A1]